MMDVANIPDMSAFLRFNAIGVDAVRLENGEIQGVAQFFYQEGEKEYLSQVRFRIDAAGVFFPDPESWVDRASQEAEGVYKLIKSHLIGKANASANSKAVLE